MIDKLSILTISRIFVTLMGKTIIWMTRKQFLIKQSNRRVYVNVLLELRVEYQ